MHLGKSWKGFRINATRSALSIGLSLLEKLMSQSMEL